MTKSISYALGIVLAAGLSVGVPVPGLDHPASAAVGKAAAKRKSPRPLPPPPPIKPSSVLRDDPKPQKPPVPLRLPKGSPAILVLPAQTPPMAMAPPPPPLPPGREGPQIKELGTLQFSPTVAAVQAAGWTEKRNYDASLMLRIRPDGSVDDCRREDNDAPAFVGAMCALIMKAARFHWTGEGERPAYGYLFVSTRWQLSPDVDAKLDLMPEGEGLPVDLMVRGGSANGGCNVQLIGLTDDQESTLCAKVRRTIAGYGGRGTNGVTFDPDFSDLSIWLRRRPAGEEPVPAVKWNTYWRSGFAGPK